MNRRLRIAQVAPPLERVPPRAYGGTERVVFELVRELDRRGHEVTTFASGDSEVPGHHVTTVPEALRPAGYMGDAAPYFFLTMRDVLDRSADFDIIHSHLEWASVLLARVSPIPVVSTFHGRLDLPWADETFAGATGGLVAISNNQASTHPSVEWAGVVHNGLTLDEAPFDRRRGDGAVLRRPDGAREGDRGSDRDRQGDRSAPPDRRQGRSLGAGAGLLRAGVQAGPRGGRLVRRVPRRARPGRPRRLVRRVATRS